GVGDGVGLLGASAQAVEILDVAAMHLGAGRGERLGRSVGANEAEHPMPGTEQFLDDRGADEAGRSGDENAHDTSSGLDAMREEISRCGRTIYAAKSILSS